MEQTLIIMFNCLVLSWLLSRPQKHSVRGQICHDSIIIDETSHSRADWPQCLQYINIGTTLHTPLSFTLVKECSRAGKTYCKNIWCRDALQKIQSVNWTGVQVSKEEVHPAHQYLYNMAVPGKTLPSQHLKRQKATSESFLLRCLYLVGF